MSLALSVPFLMDVLSRVANTPIGSDAPPLEDPQTLLEPLNVGQAELLTLLVTGLSPTTISISRFERDGTDLTTSVSDFSWGLDETDLKLGDQIDYLIEAREGDEGIAVTANFTEAIEQSGWVIGSVTSDAFEIMSSVMNGPTPEVYDAGNGTIQISDVSPDIAHA